ncbi:DUF3040 domain-containing protein [Ornithinimicrobium sufpigmenti]|uniref:DUF3040 domain-containing protein n=1 Tax=Ornithinimicrobium sufpigmenti TaxID=2508882 RepID=UPI00103695C3|nr:MULTISPECIES: DUF3040 domain-containing protein [unclassified Ornithinimicrobium]
MPLSEHEQRVLQQMEQALYAEDPRLASQLQRTAAARTSTGLDRRRLALGVLGALAGLALVVVGVMTQFLWVSIIGFLAMVLGGAWAATPVRGGGLGVVQEDGSVRVQAGGSPKAGPQGKAKPGGNFMSRMEQQWDKRKEQGP